MAIHVLTASELLPVSGLDSDVRACDGHILFDEGEALEERDIKLLQECGINAVFQIDAEHEIGLLRRKYNLVSLAPSAAPSGFTLAQSVFDEKTNQLLHKTGVVCDAEMLQEMQKRGVKEITLDFDKIAQPKTKTMLNALATRRREELIEKSGGADDATNVRINAAFVDIMVQSWNDITKKYTGQIFVESGRKLSDRGLFSDFAWEIRWERAAASFAAITISKEDAEVLTSFSLNIDPGDVTEQLINAFVEKLLSLLQTEVARKVAKTGANIMFETAQRMTPADLQSMVPLSHYLHCNLSTNAGRVALIFGFDADL